MTNSTYFISSSIDKLGMKIRVRSTSAGTHFTDYRTYTARMVGGIEQQLPLNEMVTEIIKKRLETLPVSESFIVDVDSSGDPITSLGQAPKIEPGDIVHQQTPAETNFTSTGAKLPFHWPVFKKLSATGYGSIIRATLTLHQVCASRCQFCSTINRNKKDAISLEEAKAFVQKLYFDQAEFNKEKFPEYNNLYRENCGSDIRLRGLILSGGGQPNLWPYFEEFVDWVSQFSIDLGLITNGFPSRINDDIYSKFSWVRLSVTPEDASPFYPQGKFNLQRIPKSVLESNTTFGLSYVYGPWTTDDILTRLGLAADQWNVDYVRMLTDCNLGRTEQLRAHHALSDRLRGLGLLNADGSSNSKIFHQLKYHGTSNEAHDLWNEGQCYLQSYNLFWDTTGHDDNGHSYCFPCDSVTVLADEEKGAHPSRGFDYSKWGTVRNTEVERLWTEKLTPFFDPREICSACLFMKNNQQVKDLLLSSADSNFSVPQDIPEHVNFP